MPNYQLYRTNVLLSGQLQYDLILQANGGKTIISEMHLSPISNNASYNHHIVDNVLNQSHLENIKEFYKKTSSFFYKDFVNPQLTSVYPLPKNYEGKTMDTTYEMGIKKSKKQHIYDKEYEFFCPLWLEKIDDVRDLTFNFSLYSENGMLLLKKIISFEGSWATYFTNYLTSIELNKGCDWVFDINSNSSYVTGVNVQTGLPQTKKLFKLYDDLTFRERPLLEFNNMIINELNNNQLITKQLFNFNFCFNLSDIIEKPVLDSLKSYALDLKISVLYKGEELKMMDIFSNHDYIPKMQIVKSIQLPSAALSEGNKEDEESDENVSNVLNYLQDYNCIDLINKNKIIQNTCHWNLVEQNMHFNVYNGFSPKYSSKTDIDIPYVSEDVCNISNDNFSEGNNYWCNVYQTGHITTSDVASLLSDAKYDDLYSVFSAHCWVKGVKYNYDGDLKNKDISILTILCESDKDVKNLPAVTNPDYYMYAYAEKKGYLIFSKESPKIILIYPSENDKTCLMYKQFKEEFNTIILSVPGDILSYCRDFFHILQSAKQNYQSITIHNGLIKYPAKGPSLNVKEFVYYKTNNTTHLIRYFGKIKPYFINTNNSMYFNYKWYKLYVEKKEEGDNKTIKDEYKIYANSSYQPLYPSINYFALQKDKESYTANNLQKITIS